jgi:hypothetical protein
VEDRRAPAATAGQRPFGTRQLVGELGGDREAIATRPSRADDRDATFGDDAMVAQQVEHRRPCR